MFYIFLQSFIIIIMIDLVIIKCLEQCDCFIGSVV